MKNWSEYFVWVFFCVSMQNWMKWHCQLIEALSDEKKTARLLFSVVNERYAIVIEGWSKRPLTVLNSTFADPFALHIAKFTEPLPELQASWDMGLGKSRLSTEICCPINLLCSSKLNVSVEFQSWRFKNNNCRHCCSVSSEFHRHSA